MAHVYDKLSIQDEQRIIPLRTSTSIEYVLQHDILHIFLAERSSAEHSETALHAEDHGSLL